MGKPITTVAGGICFAFPNVCLTPVGVGSVPIPYPNIGQLKDAGGEPTVKAGGENVVTTAHTIDRTTGSEAGSNGNPATGTFDGPVQFTRGSSSVNAGGSPVVRLLDPTKQNGGACVGVVLGGLATVLVGG